MWNKIVSYFRSPREKREMHSGSSVHGLGKKIRMARVEKDMNQKQLSEAIGTTQKMISKYEKGWSVPSLNTLEKLKEVLGKPYRYFLDEEDK